MLLSQLPQGSRLEVAEYGDAHRWSRTDYMLADLIDVIQAMRYEATASRTKSPGKPPQPYPRPEQDRAKLLRPRLDEWRQRHGQGGER